MIKHQFELRDLKLSILLKKLTCLIFIFLVSNAQAKESFAIDDWLISFDENACWAATLISEDPSSGEYDLNKNFQFIVSFHNGVPQPQFTVYSDTPGKIVTTASIKFNEETFDYVVIDDTAYSYPKDDRDIIFNMLADIVPYVVLGINNKKEQPTPSVSLKGFKEAYNYLSKICYFRKYPKAMGGVS